MDLNDIRSLVTVISLGAFLGLVAYTWSRRQRQAQDEAARLPFADSQPADESPGVQS